MIWLKETLAHAQKNNASEGFLLCCLFLSHVVSFVVFLAHIFAFLHHPLFLMRPDEPDQSEEYGFTTFIKGLHVFLRCILHCHLTLPFTRNSPRLSDDGVEDRLNNSYFHIPTAQRKPVLDLFKEYGVRFVFSGHWHRCGVAEGDGITQIITSAVGRQLGPDDSGLRIVRVEKDTVDYPYYSLDQLDEQAKADDDASRAPEQNK